MLILSWNVNLASLISGFDIITRSETILKTIQKLNPDILFLQESSNLFTEDLESIGYTLVGAIRSHCGLVATYTMIQNVHLKNSSFSCAGSYITIAYNNTILVNCHFIPNSHNSYNLIKNQIQTLDTEHENLLIIGDMNTDKDLDSISLKDIGTNTPTWRESFFKPGSTKVMRYDRILTNISCSSFKVHSELSGQSDHIPISIVIS